MADTKKAGGLWVASAEKCLQQAAAPEASSIVTGAALYWMKRLARQQAWTLYHANPRRGRFQVEEMALIRGRSISVRLFISNYGAVYQTRWIVDGRPWTAQQVNDAFGL